MELLHVAPGTEQELGLPHPDPHPSSGPCFRGRAMEVSEGGRICFIDWGK